MLFRGKENTTQQYFDVRHVIEMRRYTVHTKGELTIEFNVGKNLLLRLRLSFRSLIKRLSCLTNRIFLLSGEEVE